MFGRLEASWIMNEAYGELVPDISPAYRPRTKSVRHNHPSSVNVSRIVTDITMRTPQAFALWIHHSLAI